jgi:hypothetical protein
MQFSRALTLLLHTLLPNKSYASRSIPLLAGEPLASKNGELAELDGIRIMAQKLKSYTLPEDYGDSPIGDIVRLLSDTPDEAVVIRGPHGSVMGVFVAPHEYNALRAIRDLVNSKEGIAKISGTYKPSSDGVAFEKVFG